MNRGEESDNTMAFFDKSRELLKTAQKIANDTIGEDNLSKI